MAGLYAVDLRVLGWCGEFVNPLHACGRSISSSPLHLYSAIYARTQVVITILLIVLCCMLGCCGKKKRRYAHQ